VDPCPFGFAQGGLCAGVTESVKATKIADSLVDSRALAIQGGFGQAINGLAFQTGQ